MGSPQLPQLERLSLESSDDEYGACVMEDRYLSDTDMPEPGQNGSLIWHMVKNVDNGIELKGRVVTFSWLLAEPDPVKGFDFSQTSYEVLWTLPNGKSRTETLSRAKVLELDVTPASSQAAAIAPIASTAARAASGTTLSSGRDPPQPAQPAANQPAGLPLPTSSARVQQKPSQAKQRSQGKKQSALERVGRAEVPAAAAKAVSSETVPVQATSAKRGRESGGVSSGAGTTAGGVAKARKKSPSESKKERALQQKPAKAKGPPYPRSVSFTPGDKPLNVWITEPLDDSDAEFVVEAIVDERMKGKKRQYLVKWKGYELKPDDWNGREGLEDCVALDVWEAKQKSSS